MAMYTKEQLHLMDYEDAKKLSGKAEQDAFERAKESAFGKWAPTRTLAEEAYFKAEQTEGQIETIYVQSADSVRTEKAIRILLVAVFAVQIVNLIIGFLR